MFLAIAKKEIPRPVCLIRLVVLVLIGHLIIASINNSNFSGTIRRIFVIYFNTWYIFLMIAKRKIARPVSVTGLVSLRIQEET